MHFKSATAAAIAAAITAAIAAAVLGIALSAHAQTAAKPASMATHCATLVHANYQSVLASTTSQEISEKAAEAIPAPFDRAFAGLRDPPGRLSIEKTIASRVTQSTGIVTAAHAVGISKLTLVQPRVVRSGCRLLSPSLGLASHCTPACWPRLAPAILKAKNGRRDHGACGQWLHCDPA